MNTDLNNPSKKDKHLCEVEKNEKGDCTCPPGAMMATVGQKITFNEHVLDTFDVEGFRPVHYDLLVLCAALEMADRRWKRSQCWSRKLHMTVPVFACEVWQQRHVRERVHSVLRHLTGDDWQLTFVSAKENSSIGGYQRALNFPIAETFVIAYSDGLDSRAVATLSGDENEALCIRIAGSQQRMSVGDSYFTQIPFKAKGHGSRESSFRSRGFQFAAVTALAAHICKITRIVVPDSGQSALGPVLLPLHNIYPDYRNHPTFFRKMAQFIMALLGHPVRYDQSRLWSTKGQTLQAFLNISCKSKEDLRSTRSCWQSRRVVNIEGKKRQCGLCAACLLRRQSLHAVDVTETSDTYAVSDLSTPYVAEALSDISSTADQNLMLEYGIAGTRFLQRLADLSAAPDSKLRAHVSEIAEATGATPRETLKKLRALLLKHSAEWRAFLSAQGDQSFLKNWLVGGRNG